MEAMEAQDFVKDSHRIFTLPKDNKVSMRLPAKLIPKCPEDGISVVMNLRIDDSFVEDEGWHKASQNYYEFLQMHKDKHILFMELGVGANTPIIIKYPFWQMTMDNTKAIYVCINYGEAYCPKEIADRSLCINGDIAGLLEEMMEKAHIQQ